MILGSHLRIGNKINTIVGIQTVSEIISSEKENTINFFITCKESGTKHAPIIIDGVKINEDIIKTFDIPISYLNGDTKMPYVDFNRFRLYLNSNCVHIRYDDGYFPKIFNIEYVHEFQNLYLATMKKELNERI